ncbi:MAG: zinc ribbon domain-containing protein [Acidobacteria bacterium]|nr:zinc ribbon domain-containing protein [Acidobacteriota bacterium]
MYCPNCGRQATQGQRFCKSCGFNLLALSQSVSGQVVTPEEAKENRRRLEEVRHGVRTTFTGIGLMFFFFFFFHSMGFAAIGAIIFFAGLGRIASATVFATPRRALEFRWPTQSEVQPSRAPLPVSAPPPQLETAPPSVTEHTTIRLEHPEYEFPKERQRNVE